MAKRFSPPPFCPRPPGAQAPRHLHPTLPRETPTLPGRQEGAARVTIATATSRGFALAGGLLIVALVALPLIASRSLMQDLVFIFYMFTLAQFWNLLAGYVGLVSVGQQTFVGLGGYLLFALTVMMGLDPLLAILLAGIIAAVF